MDDDLDDYKLETTFQPDHVTHITYKTDRGQGFRRLRVEHRWHLKSELGSGSFGTVRLQITDDGQQRAVKAVRKTLTKTYGIDYRRELAALTIFSRAKFAQDEVFVKFLGWFEDPEFIFLAMEYFPLGDLSNFQGQDFSEPDVKDISLQLLRGLEIMHHKGFTHRDLKPQNIFVVQTTPWWVKIGDFGITKRVRPDNSTQLRTVVGTQGYEAPEIRGYVSSTLDGEDSDDETHVYTNYVDIWSLGCIMYRLVTHQLPFPTTRSLKKFCDEKTPFPNGLLSADIHSTGAQFIESLLTKEPLRRPTAASALSNIWFTLASSIDVSHDNSSPSPNAIQINNMVIKNDDYNFSQLDAMQKIRMIIKHNVPTIIHRPMVNITVESWEAESRQTEINPPNGDQESKHFSRVFGVPLEKSIKYASVLVFLENFKPGEHIYSHIPTIVVKVGEYLKKKETCIETLDLSVLNVLDLENLRAVFNCPPSYGKGFDWQGYTEEDAVYVLMEWLELLPDLWTLQSPLRKHHSKLIIPPIIYECIQNPGITSPYPTNELVRLLSACQQFIQEFSAPMKRTLLYLLHLWAVIADKMDIMRNTLKAARMILGRKYRRGMETLRFRELLGELLRRNLIPFQIDHKFEDELNDRMQESDEDVEATDIMLIWYIFAFLVMYRDDLGGIMRGDLKDIVGSDSGSDFDSDAATYASSP